MNLKDNLPDLNNELALKQADEIIDIFKNIKKTLNSRFVEIAKRYGFTTPQLVVIFHLYERPSITLNELSDYMQLTKSTVSGIVDRLTNQGVVIREIPKDNRRIVKLSISEEFKKNNDICNMKKTFVSGLISNNIKNMDPAEVEKIIYGLRQFNLLLNQDN
ncbi:MarR family winged helix-turn-helix transcriptional regulator [Clostridium uliginosum]|uniref:MarR family protein n=1 Tax=Clostridium uliginosum TaxID=119641 RepID=A0A1I1IYA4_9CLOT|nr:MarR family transcriptional regulator [Clostridium uliginosum]SFC41277.1 MarR family protein [Clostridium uliginosum]